MNDQNQKETLGIWFYLASISLTLWVIFFNVNSGFVINQFSATFSAFGAELPALTKFITDNTPIVWIAMLCLAVIQLCLLLLTTIIRTAFYIKIFFLFFMINFIIEVTIITAMYLPIFNLGSVVG